MRNHDREPLWWSGQLDPTDWHLKRDKGGTSRPSPTSPCGPTAIWWRTTRAAPAVVDRHGGPRRRGAGGP
ncbi:hypothetical protein NKH77_43515 [Streptomyces sp. M19]